MRRLLALARRFSELWSKARRDRELTEELAQLVEMETASHVSRGMPPAQARRAALMRVEVESTKAKCREHRGLPRLEALGQDVRYACRTLRKKPGFAAVALATIALGIGANTAVFSVVYAALLRPLPFPDPQELVSVAETSDRGNISERGLSYEDLLALERSGIFAEVAGVTRHQLTLSGAGDPTLVTALGTTSEMFPLLNITPLRGRYLLPEDEPGGAAPVAVLSEPVWRNRFAADPRIIGAAINLDQRAFTVVGVMPAGFGLPGAGRLQEVWIPVTQDPLFRTFLPHREIHGLFVLARLKSGVPLARTQSQADAVSAQLAHDFPAESRGWRLRLVPLRREINGELRAPLLVLLAAVGFLLLLACVNIANLLLAKATSRVREIAVRQALGAARGRIISQLMTEAAVIGLLGAAFGVALAFWGVRAAALVLPSALPGVRNVELDGWVLGFAFFVSVLAVLLFGLAPALLASVSSIQVNLKQSVAQTGESGGRLRLRSLLAGAEIALAMVLVVAAGLLVRSLIAMTSVNPGFESAHVLKAAISLPRYQYSSPQQWAAFSSDLLERIHAQPGLEASAIAVPLPVVDQAVNLKFSIADHAPLPPSLPATADYVSVSPQYFRVMGIPLVRGRGFSEDNSSTRPAVAIISQSLVREYFSNEDPLGKELVFGFPPGPPIAHQIVGVVADIHDAGLNQNPAPMMYVPFAQAPFWGGELVVNSTLPAADVVGAIRRVVASIDKNLPVTDVAAMPDVIAASVSEPRFRTWLLAAFGFVALLLAATGVFGVVSYSVACRRREFGVRAALGASPGLIAGLVLRESASTAGTGLLAGLAASLVLVRFLRS
ncbi:MAG TPA: ABC transporter permease, partial [Terriglobales bacterium]|nr:ABC transporter permease [Terriglobales bacterium]